METSILLLGIKTARKFSPERGCDTAIIICSTIVYFLSYDIN